MSIEFYEYPISPYCRSVKLIGTLLKVPLDIKIVDLLQKDHLKPEYVQMNPFHQVPTINDDGFFLSESRAIACYLVDKYSPNHSLYPQDLQKRAIIDQMLYFDSGTLAPAMSGLIRPIYFQNKQPGPEASEKVKEILKTLDLILSGKTFVAGNTMTIADITMRATFSMNEVLNSVDLSEFKNVKSWTERVRSETSPDYVEINDQAMEQFSKYTKEKLAQLNSDSK